jgi:hypothetical protein
VAVVLGLVAQRALRPASFGDLGSYRADSLVEIMSREPAHQGRDACAVCHARIHDLHQKDVHQGVQCEVCHGPGKAHVSYYRAGGAAGGAAGGRDAVVPDDARMPKEYTLEGCLFCHRALDARPSTFGQVDPREHFEFLHVTDPTTRCVECHSPHEPLFLLERVSDARVHPVIFECADCHDATPATSHKEVADHPTIFVCADCHPSVVRDFETHQHAFLRCTACHLFRRESDIAGRVFLNGSRQFCLLCHERKPFKDPAQVPQIVFAEHVVEMAPIMRRQAGPLLEDATACLQCHLDYIHDTGLIRRLQEQER